MRNNPTNGPVRFSRNKNPSAGTTEDIGKRAVGGASPAAVDPAGVDVEGFGTDGRVMAGRDFIN